MNKKKKNEYRLWRMFIMCVVGIGINLIGSVVAAKTGTPLYLDTNGTVLIAAMGGYLPGIIVGLFSNLIRGLWEADVIYYSVINVFIAIITHLFVKKKFIKNPVGIILLIIIMAVIGGGHGAVLSWILNFASNEKANFSAHIKTDILWDIVDKAIAIVLLVILMKVLPKKLQDDMRIEGWQQAPLSDGEIKEAKKGHNRKISLRTKILLLLFMACIAIGAAAMIISIYLYRTYTIQQHCKLADGTANLVASEIDPEMVDEYIKDGENVSGYLDTEEQLKKIKESSSDIEYVYVYKIQEDGCYVVFDLDTEDLEGADPGTIIPFDESFDEYIPTLLKGGKIDPIISNDTYGYLITAYSPVYNEAGECVCYAATDISMDIIKNYEMTFIAKLLSLFVGFFVFVIAVGLWISEYNIVLPVNTMAISASSFAYDNEAALEENLKHIKQLKIHTGDEIENMYQAFSRTTEKSMNYVHDLNSKTETISQMQNALIIVMADMVENRDENTGDHIKKTAEYTKIIMDKMKELGYYKGQLTTRFMNDVVNSAPLHDIGKIHVSDMILNKPGKLTDEEFEIMKSHTTAGADILDQVIAKVPDSGYLKEAKNLAEFHHEKWNGKGYPKGLAGEEIPLSARIMAVADVFDALVSDRCYKKAFPFEKAMSIIKEDAGTHFDPLVADAFIQAEDEVRKVAEKHSK